MKKRIFAVLASVLVLVTVLAVPVFAAECPHSNTGYESIGANSHQETCYDCGEWFGVYEEHSFGAWSYDDNRHYQTCSVCGYENGGYHEYDSGEYDGGFVVYTCWCGAQMYEHMHSWVTEQYSSNFYHRIRCTTCGETQDQTHRYDDGVYTPASGGTLAYYTYTCKDCNYVDVRYISPSHTVCDESKYKVKYYNADSHRYSCSICDKQFKLEPHQWSVVVTKQPTPSENGIRTYTCIICNHIKTETIDYIDFDKLLADMTQEEATDLYKKIFEKHRIDLIANAEILAPYVEHFATVIFPDVVQNGHRSEYFVDFAEIVEFIVENSNAADSMYTKGYNDAMATLINDNPVQGFFQGTWSAVVHFISVVGNGVAIGGITLMNVICTFAIIIFAWFVIKLLKGGG